jgi:thiamine biosynthesis lipoprotein ApbE
VIKLVFRSLLLIGLLPPYLLQAQASQRLYTTTHPAMGTTFTLYLYSASTIAAATASEEVFDEIDRIEQLLSNYRQRALTHQPERWTGACYDRPGDVRLS